MITKKTRNRLIDVSRELIHLPPTRHKHFSFLLFKKKIVSIGWNNGFKSHPIANRYGHRFDCIHSELSCLINCNTDLNKLILVNIRLMSDGTLGRAFPCRHCNNMLLDYGFDHVICSDYNNRFYKFILK
jgi:deoxycytidylate deaminase